MCIYLLGWNLKDNLNWSVIRKHVLWPYINWHQTRVYEHGIVTSLQVGGQVKTEGHTMELKHFNASKYLESNVRPQIP